jgi:hypothetical protein
MKPLLAAAAFAVVAAVTFCAAPASASTSVTFPYEDARLLHVDEKNGGLAYLTEGVEDADEPVPVVVFLHGLNEYGPPHFWYGLFNTDLRPLADEIVAGGNVRPFILAAPSQTVDAGGLSTLWTDFDLDTFLHATQTALPEGVEIDRDAVILVGHSGAGCNPKGGLLGTWSPFVATKPAGLVAVDTCFDASVGTVLANAPVGSSVWVYYQPFTWGRDWDLFRGAFEQELARVPGRVGHIVIDDKSNADPHSLILVRAMREAIPALLPLETPDPYE